MHHSANLPGSAVTAAAVVIVLLAAGAGGMIGNQAPGTAGTWPLRCASLPGHRPPDHWYFAAVCIAAGSSRA